MPWEFVTTSNNQGQEVGHTIDFLLNVYIVKHNQGP